MEEQDPDLTQWFADILDEYPTLEGLSEEDTQRIKNGRYEDEDEGLEEEDEDGNDINHPNFNFTLLHFAAKGKMPDVAARLIDGFGMNPNAKSSMGRTPLTLAILGIPGVHDSDALDTVRVLVERGANVNEVDLRTPLGYALSDRNTAIVDYLLEHGADVNAKDEWNRTPIFNARDLSHIDKLVARGADVTVVDNSGNTPIFDAIIYGGGKTLTLVKKLISIGVDWSVKNKDGHTAETFARERGQLPKTVEYLTKLRKEKEAKEKAQRAVEVQGASDIALEKGLPANVLKNINEYAVGRPVQLPAVPIRIRKQNAEKMRAESAAKREQAASADAVAAMKAGRKTRMRKTKRRKTIRLG